MSSLIMSENLDTSNRTRVDSSKIGHHSSVSISESGYDYRESTESEYSECNSDDEEQYSSSDGGMTEIDIKNINIPKKYLN